MARGNSGVVAAVPLGPWSCVRARLARRCVGADDGGCDGAFDGSDVGDSLALRKQAHFACQLIYDRGQATNGSEGRLTIAWE